MFSKTKQVSGVDISLDLKEFKSAETVFLTWDMLTLISVVALAYEFMERPTS